MSNVRRFLRYSVSIPIFIREAGVSENKLKKLRNKIISLEDVDELKEIDEKLGGILRNELNLNLETDKIIYAIDFQINFIGYLVDLLIDGKDPSLQKDFKYRVREFKKQKIKNTLLGSKIGALVEGIEVQVRNHILELLETVEMSVEGKIFLYPNQKKERFKTSKFVRNLSELVDNGVTLAVVFELLIRKLRIWESIFFKLKEKNKAISDSTKWKFHDVNLSAGGLKITNSLCFRQFAFLDIFMQLGDEVLVCRGKVSSAMKKERGECLQVIEFDFLSIEKAEIITHFLQRQELKDAMKSVNLN